MGFGVGGVPQGEDGGPGASGPEPADEGEGLPVVETPRGLSVIHDEAILQAADDAQGPAADAGVVGARLALIVAVGPRVPVEPPVRDTALQLPGHHHTVFRWLPPPRR